MFRNILGSVVLLATIIAAPAYAQSATYTYTGNNFDTFVGSTWDASNAVTLTMTLDTLPVNVTDLIVAVSDYTFSDGINIYTPASPGGIQARITTDASGNITQWLIGWGQQMPGVVGATVNSVVTGSNFDSAEIMECQIVIGSDCSNQVMTEGGRVDGNPGTWSAPVVTLPTPVPTISVYGLALTAFGLILLAGNRRRISST